MGCDFALSAIVGIWTWTWSLVNEPAGYVCEENCDDDKKYLVCRSGFIWSANVAQRYWRLAINHPFKPKIVQWWAEKIKLEFDAIFESLDLTNGSSMCLFSLRAVTFASHWAPWCIIGKYGHSHPEIKIYILSCLSLTQKQTHNLLAPLKCS